MNPARIQPLDELYPPGSFFCARTTREAMGWNVANPDQLPQYRLDATPAQLVGFAGAMPFVAHEAAATQLALDFAHHCGLPGAQQLHTYRQVAEAEKIALGLIRHGGKLVHNFGTLPGLESSGGLLMMMDEHLRLNAKQSRAELVQPRNLPPAHVFMASELSAFLDAHSAEAWFIKIAGPVSTGGGAGVWHCHDAASRNSLAQHLASRLDDHEPLVAEADCKPVNSWCAGLSILDEGVTWLGASRQIFYSPARQAGNELALAPPLAVRELSLEIAEKARIGGFRGIAGFDIGEIAEAEPVVFDLNFRPNSSTGLLLAGHVSMEKTGLPVARSFFLRHDGPLGELLDAVKLEANAGRIIPGSMFDAQQYKDSFVEPATRSCLDGWLLAETAEEVTSYSKTVAARLQP